MIAPFDLRRIVPLLLLLLLLLPAPALAAWPHEPYGYAPIAPSSGDQTIMQVLEDGSGGAFFLFTDKRSGTEDVYLQRLTATGQLASGWPSSGLPVAAIAGQKLQPQMTGDGSGGVIVVWADRRSGNADIYGQRVLGNGALAGGNWPSTGLQVSFSGNNERRPQICSDGAGGALICWELNYSLTDTDVYGAHVTGSGTFIFDTSLDPSLHDSRQISMASDGAGGFFVAYQDSSSLYGGHSRIYGMRVNGSGSLLISPTLLFPEGISYSDINPKIVADGSGGLQFVWENNETHSSFDLQTERLSPTFGVVSSGFYTSYGLDTPDYNIIADGTGGVIASWQERLGHPMVARATATGRAPGWPVDFGNVGFTAPVPLAPDGSAGAITAYGNGFVTAQRLAADGGGVPHWGSGVPVALSGAYTLAAATDGAHGFILAWTDYTVAFVLQIYAQRLDRFGALGNAEPAITSVTDVRGDQGGHVRLAWNSSYLDSDPYYAVSSYYVWRQTSTSLAAAAVQRGARWTDDPATTSAGPDGATTRLFRHSASPAYAWEFISSQPANGSSQYTYVAPTTRESLPSGNPRTLFLIEARWSQGNAYWDSAPDSGYSVDNLAPGPPAQLAATWYSGTSVLHWLPNAEPDLYGYRVYRGTTVDFTPSVSNRIAAPTDTGYVDAAGAAYYYKVSAVDIHGNESLFSTVLPQGVTGLPAGDAAPRLALAVASANPARGDAVFRIDLTRSGPVRLAVYDASGRFVREVASGTFAAGEWFRKWDGGDGAGHAAPSGLYFARLDAEGRSIMRKVVLVR